MRPMKKAGAFRSILELRTRLQAAIAGLDQCIAEIAAIAHESKREGRSGNGKTLEKAIAGYLESKNKPQGLTEITKGVIESGYQTQSAFQNFRTTVAHTLKRMRARLRKLKDGYTVHRNGSAAHGKAGAAAS